MIKLFVFLSALFFGTSVAADVPRIALRFNNDGKIIDIVTDAVAVRAETQEGSNPTTSTENDSTSPTPDTQRAETTLEAACDAAHGTMVTYGTETYCCNGNGHVLKADMSGWSEYPLIPQCGCSTYRTSFQKNGNGDYVCCEGYNVVSSKISGEGVDSSPSDLCGCPDQFTLDGVSVKVRDMTAVGSTDLVCCAKGNKLQSDNNSLPWAACQCPEDMEFGPDDLCVEKCSAQYPTACTTAETCAPYGFWCGEEGHKHCVEKMVCHNGNPQDETTCGCESVCSAASPRGCGSEEACKDVGGTWCPFNNCEANINQCTCEEGGTLKPEAGICCKNGWRAVAGSNGYDALSITECGCPSSGTTAVTVNSKGVCCVGLKKYNETTKAYDTKDEGCCIGTNREWDETAQTCNCKAGFVEKTDGTCGCPDEMVWSDLRQQCVYCATSEHCRSQTPDKPYCKTDANDNLGKCVACLYSEHCGACEKDKPVCDTSYYGGTYTCKSCRDIDASKPWRGQALSDPTICNSCYECIEASDCATGEICSLGKCMNCVHYQTQTTDTPNRGCGADRPICISAADGKNQCVECLSNNDCKDRASPICSSETHSCVRECGNVGVNPETGECNCTGDTPVYNPNTHKCVSCYDSISEDWTDLGCGKKKTDSTYDPTESAVRGTPICLERSNNGLGTCVSCTKDQHCQTGQVCGSDHTCGCENGTVWLELAHRCVDCTVNYGVTPEEGGKACAQSTPTCDTKTYKCKCEKNYDGTEGNGICTAEKPVCDSTGKYCRLCGNLKPYFSVPQKACVTCGSNATWNGTNSKCTCKRGYAVLESTPKDGCVDAHIPTVRSCSDIKRTITQNCPEVELFSFKTVNGVVYHVEFSGTMRTDDMLRLVCGNSIISASTTTAGNKMKEKKWCRSKSSSGNVECTKAEKTELTKDDNIYIIGDGSSCAMYIANVKDNCTENACSGGSVSVVAKTTTFDYLADK